MSKKHRKTIIGDYSIADQLQEGDRKRIAEATGYSLPMVKAVINGTRSNSKITAAAGAIIKERQMTDKLIREKFSK